MLNVDPLTGAVATPLKSFEGAMVPLVQKVMNGVTMFGKFLGITPKNISHTSESMMNDAHTDVPIQVPAVPNIYGAISSLSASAGQTQRTVVDVTVSPSPLFTVMVKKTIKDMIHNEMSGSVSNGGGMGGIG